MSWGAAAPPPESGKIFFSGNRVIFRAANWEFRPSACLTNIDDYFPKSQQTKLAHLVQFDKLTYKFFSDFPQSM